MNPVWHFLNGVPTIGAVSIGTATITTTLAGDGSASAPSYSFASSPGSGFSFSPTTLSLSLGGAAKFQWDSTTFYNVVNTAQMAWGVSADLITAREGADHLFQRRTTNAQRASWANTYTSATNYAAFSVDMQTTANVAIVGTRTAASGTGIPLRLVAQASSAGSMGTVQLGTDGSLTLGGAPAGATTASRLIKKITSMGDGSAVDVFTVTVPNAGQSAGVKVTLVSANGSTDAFESTRVAEGFVAIARTSGVATVPTVATLDLAQIATVGSGATHTLAYGVSAVSGLASATQTFTITVTVNDSGNVGGNQVVAVAELINSEASGVTIA